MSQFGPVATPKELSRFILDNRHTPIFKIQPTQGFLYGKIDDKTEGSISLQKYDPTNDVIYFTYGLKVIDSDDEKDFEDTSLTVIIGVDGYTIMLKEDAKELFEYIEDEKVNPTDEDLLLKTIEVYCK